MRAKKPKEFLFEKKGSCIKGTINSKRDFKNRKKGIIYLSNTHLRIIFKNGGERIIPLNTIKKLNLYKISPFGDNILKILIQTDADELYTFGCSKRTSNNDRLNKLYRLLSEVIANLSDGGVVHIGPESGPDLEFWCVIIFIIIIALLILVLWNPLIKLFIYFYRQN